MNVLRPLDDAIVRPFGIGGVISTAVELVKGNPSGHVPKRQLRGWLTTYGHLTDDGTVVPTVDREGQINEAAAQLGMIDWSAYVRNGLWNEGHRAPLPHGRFPRKVKGNIAVYVGVPTSLTFHDGTTELSRSHRKVGFHTGGHLFDRNDPRSWTDYTDHVPTERELRKADELWEIAEAVKGTPASLAFSAHGLMAQSKCKRRIVWATISQAAIVTVPINPDCDAEAVEMVKGLIGDSGDPLDIIGRSKVGDSTPSPCGRCSCAPGLCEGLRRMVKGSVSPSGVVLPVTGSNPTQGSSDELGDADIANRTRSFDRLIRAIMEQNPDIDQDTAIRWIEMWVDHRKSRREAEEERHEDPAR